MTTIFRRRSSAVLAMFGVGLLAGAPTVAAQGWPSWRGVADDGMAHGDAPVSWDATEDVKWKVAIPGRGHSSPVVWGNQIFVTTAVPMDNGSASTQSAARQGGPANAGRASGGTHPAGAGPGRPPSGGHPGGGQIQRGGGWSPHGDSGPQTPHRFVLLSLDKTTGEVLWERAVMEATPHEGFHAQYGSFASNSPVTDGEHVFAYFGSRGLYSYDLEGTLNWKKDLGQMTKFLQFGEGTPLVLHGDRLIIKRDHEGDSFIVALDKSTGAELWRTARDEATSWSPPLVVEHQGRKEILVAATKKVRSYDFETGELIWEVAGLGRNQIPAPVHQGDMVYVMSGFIAPNLMAIRLGEQGDLTGSDAVVWENTRANSYTPSPVLHEQQLYVLTDSGILTNLDAATGEIHYRERLPGASNFKASPVGVNGKLYLVSEEGTACSSSRWGPSSRCWRRTRSRTRCSSRHRRSSTTRSSSGARTASTASARREPCPYSEGHCQVAASSGRLEPAHLALALTGRLMRELRAIVFVLPGTVDHGRHHGPVRGRVAAELVRDQPARLAALSFGSSHKCMHDSGMISPITRRPQDEE